MANITPYTDAIKNAVYGEEVRDAIVDAIEKVNDDNESYQEIKDEITADRVHVDNQVTLMDAKVTNGIAAVSAQQTASVNAVNSAGNTKITEMNGILAEAEETVEQVNESLADVKAYIGYTNDVLGIEIDYANKTMKRIGGASSLAPGSGFNPYPMYGNRRRCNVADNGTINTYYGDEGYIENGSNGQVMVYQPKFYYKVVPLKLDKIANGLGYHLRKARYFVSDTPKPGFKLHPAFYDVNGKPVDFILLSAFEGCLWDVSAASYNMNDAQVMELTADKLSSIAGAKPASGLTQQFTRPNVEQMAQNRGSGWHGDMIKAESANQLLMIVELGTMNTQAAIENGVVSITDDTAYNCSSLTGSTSALGNATGAATETINEINGVQTTYNTNGRKSITYRGMENPWGNIWKLVYGVNIYVNVTTGEHQAYICSDYAFAESKKTGNYTGAGFTLAKTDGYISAMGYSEAFDWLFMPSETLGASNLPVGDYYYQNTTTTGYRIARLGGHWGSGGGAGGFYWDVADGVGYRFRTVGGRLVYVPTIQES